MDRRSDHASEWAELWRGARLAGVAVVSAVVTGAAVIAGGGALLPEREAPPSSPIHIVADR